MSWLPTPTGRTAAEFPLAISGGGSIPSYLLQRHDPYAEVIKAIAPAIKDYIQQQKADAIANQFLNMENPPRAEAVDQYGATYDPQLALRQGLNSPTEPPATAPNRGGEQAYKADLLYRKMLEDQQNQQLKSENSYWDTEVKKARSRRDNAYADKPGRGAAPFAPVIDEQTGMVWNGRQWVKIKSDTPAKTDPWENTMAVARGKMEGDKFVGSNDGDMIKLVTPSGYSMVVPFASYEGRKKQFSGANAFKERQAALPEPDLPPVSEQAPTMAPTAPQLSAEDQQALAWAKSHPSDPRSTAILKKLGVQ